mmetsp:Transcript_123460/g.348886  ORF Transcript_123460/g.348886 Transcript_123460/m.348886 type:complete len:335 (-) Transcript_123460:143-1147(-)|eukprot:CAMPEP_0117539964 /NCGR_PEP_ID=MMETSP0784-20121206/43255_1 /TAXON_ID=39447 /ORGANISM="" /LENGTH=334 /DNA_ID=CAMNT_0005336605 /DNA_START=93 /DNA_END=1097 /DNA_ORIENTATION=-
MEMQECAGQVASSLKTDFPPADQGVHVNLSQAAASAVVHRPHGHRLLPVLGLVTKTPDERGPNVFSISTPRLTEPSDVEDEAREEADLPKDKFVTVAVGSDASSSKSSSDAAEDYCRGEHLGEILLKITECVDEDVMTAVLKEAASLNGVVRVVIVGVHVVVYTQTLTLAADVDFLIKLLSVVKGHGVRNVELVNGVAVTGAVAAAGLLDEFVQKIDEDLEPSYLDDKSGALSIQDLDDSMHVANLAEVKRRNSENRGGASSWIGAVTRTASSSVAWVLRQGSGSLPHDASTSEAGDGFHDPAMDALQRCSDVAEIESSFSSGSEDLRIYEVAM